MYVSMLLSPYLPTFPPLRPPPSCVHKSVLNVCVSIAALQIGASVYSMALKVSAPIPLAGADHMNKSKIHRAEEHSPYMEVNIC